MEACHQEPPPPVIYQGGMCFGGLDESLFSRAICLLALPKITILFLLHSCYKFLNIAGKKNITQASNTEFNLLLKKKKPKDCGGTSEGFVFAVSCGGMPR